jgi:hypothetical protein
MPPKVPAYKEAGMYVVMMFDPGIGVIDSVATDSYDLAMSTADAMLSAAYDYDDVSDHTQVIVLAELQREFAL